MMIKVIETGFIPRQDMRTHVRIGIIAMVSNMFLNLLFVIPLHHFWQIGHLGLAAATSVSAFINALMLLFILRRDDIYKPADGWLKFSVILTLAVTVMLLVLLLLLNYAGGIESWHHQDWWQRVTNISMLCFGGFIAYVGCLFACGFRPADFRGPAKATSR